MKLREKYYFFYLIFLLVLCNAPKQIIAQNHKDVDSLLHVLNNAKEDTTRLKIYVSLCLACDLKDNLKYGELTLQLADKLLDEITDEKERKTILKHKAEAFNYIAVYYEEGNERDFVKAMEYYEKSLKIDEEIGDKQASGYQLFNIGKFYFNQGLFSRALEYDLKSLSINQEVGDKKAIGTNILGIAKVYDIQGNYAKALEYGFKSLVLYQESGDKTDVAQSYGNLSSFSEDKGDYSKAIDYAEKELTIFQEIGNKNAIGQVIGNIGEYYTKQGDFDKAMEYEQKALAMFQELSKKGGIGKCYVRIARIKRKQDDYTDAIDYDRKAVEMWRGGRDKSNIPYTYIQIGEMYFLNLKNYKSAKIYLDSAIYLSYATDATDGLKELELGYSQRAILDSITGNYKAEAEDFKNYVFYRDSLKNLTNSQQTVKMQMNYEFDQLQESEKAEQAQKDLQVAADNRKHKIIISAVGCGLLLVLVFSGFVLRSLRITRKQKQLIEVKNKETEEQKKVIEEKNKDILDSIMYAKRLQDAILPPLSLIKQYFPESFVLYKPKDIVAGDFYWMEKTGDTILIAAADCTGHGVPGALVSVVCSNALNRTVKEFKITEPGKILDKVRELVLETFEKSESNVQDGMDISLASLTPSKGGIQIQWAGAFNTLWYIQNGEMKESLADKQPIGKTDNPKPFTTHTIRLNPLSEGREAGILYLFTDGYADQFGGPKGKKFKYKQLQQLIMDNCKLTMAEQKKILEQTLENWKGSLEQVDDILIIGMRV
ncbi:MAG: tetratricopeptide repeat protein [Bacteroidia bacterium]